MGCIFLGIVNEPDRLFVVGSARKRIAPSDVRVGDELISTSATNAEYIVRPTASTCLQPENDTASTDGIPVYKIICKVMNFRLLYGFSMMKDDQSEFIHPIGGSTTTFRSLTNSWSSKRISLLFG
jgi:hypothetical protein